MKKSSDKNEHEIGYDIWLFGHDLSDCENESQRAGFEAAVKFGGLYLKGQAR